MSKENKKEDWMQKKWRPMMAIMYMVVCIFDFIIFPIGFTVVQFWEIQPENDKFRQWEPLTLVGAGLFHMAMGAVLGITAWSRGQEKIAGVASPALSPSTPTAPTPTEYTYTEPLPSGMPHRISPQVGEVKVGYGGKLAPPESPQPLI